MKFVWGVTSRVHYCTLQTGKIQKRDHFANKIKTDTSPKLTATLNAQTNDITNVGNMTGNVHNLDVREFDGIQSYLNQLDMGISNPSSFSSSLEYLAYNLAIDFDDGNSNFTGSNAIEADFGTL